MTTETRANPATDEDGIIARAVEVLRRETTALETTRVHGLTPAPSTPWALRAALESVLDHLPERDEAVRADERECVAAEIRGVAADPARRRPREKDGEFPTDLANDFEWAAIIAEGSTS